MRIDSRSSLYYNTYKYAMTWQQDEIGCVRSLDQKKMLGVIRMRRDYERRRHSSYQNANTIDYVSRFSTRCRSNLEGIRALLAAETAPKKLVFTYSGVTVYTNNLGLYDQILECNWIESVNIKQAELSRLPDTIVLQNPQHQYRTYFRERALSKLQKTTLAKWVIIQGNEIAASKSLKLFLMNDWSYGFWKSSDATRSYYYIEHNSLQYETMLSMVCSGMVRKTLLLVKKQ